ncbi:MAG: hypothetical protein IJV50_00545 [Lachnospiraceae bacterium]|nr:hypothetical protein [Lachnospiraceae bacterium]
MALFLGVCLCVLGGCQQAGTIHAVKERKSTELEQYYGNCGSLAEDDSSYYLVSEDSRLYVIDKEIFAVRPACRDALCLHDGGCAYSGKVDSVVNVQGQIFVSFAGMAECYEPNSIYCLNPITLTASKVYEAKQPIMILQNDRDHLRCTWQSVDGSQSGVWSIYPQTGERTELLDEYMYALSGQNDQYLYAVNQDGIALQIDLDTGEKKRISPLKLNNIQLDQGNLYAEWYNGEQGWIELIQLGADGQKAETLLTNVYSCQVWQGRVFYQNGDNALAVYDIATDQAQVLLENISPRFYVLPGAEKLIAIQENRYICMNMDGSEPFLLFESQS